MKEKVYLETSIISYLTSRPARDIIVAGRQAMTIEWWETGKSRYDLYVSSVVVKEAEDGDPEAVQRRMEAIRGIPTLTVSDHDQELARKLVDNGLVPVDYPEDALHISICALNGIDYLLTWNCAHLANAAILRKMIRFLEKEGAVCPVICTPAEVMEG